MKYRYSTIYNKLFVQSANERKASIESLIRKKFNNAKLMTNVKRLISTQYIAKSLRKNGDFSNFLHNMTNVSEFVQSRSCRIIQRATLDFLYKPNGAMFRKILRDDMREYIVH